MFKHFQTDHQTHRTGWLPGGTIRYHVYAGARFNVNADVTGGRLNEIQDTTADITAADLYNAGKIRRKVGLYPFTYRRMHATIFGIYHQFLSSYFRTSSGIEGDSQ